jgi:hypothetical protein
MGKDRLCSGLFKRAKPGRTLTPDEQVAWDDFYGLWRTGSNWPSPSDCEAFMDRFQINDRRELLKDYQYYIETGEQRRPDVWRDRRNW